METNESTISGMLETCLQILDAARAQRPATPTHILTAIEETCADLRARLAELRASSP
jgi:hypothetical protein